MQPCRLRLVSLVDRAYSLDPLEQMEAIGGVNADFSRWKLSQEAAIAAIEAGTDEFVVDANGVRVRLVVLTHGGQKYLKTERAKKHSDGVLRLVPD